MCEGACVRVACVRDACVGVACVRVHVCEGCSACV